MASTGSVESKAGSVGYAQCSERILTFSTSMGIKFYPSQTHGANYQGQRVVFTLVKDRRVREAKPFKDDENS